MYTRALSNIRSSTWLSLRDCALTRSPSRTRTALAASLSPASWAEPDSDVAQTRTNNSLIVLIKLARRRRPGCQGAEARPASLPDPCYQARNRDPLPILVKPCVHKTFSLGIRLPAIHSLDFKNAGNDRRVAVQMHHHRFRQELHGGGCPHLRHSLRLGLQYAIRVDVDECVVKDPL